MAYEIGTATDHFDLMNKLLTFLQTNPDLVAANENWTFVEGNIGVYDTLNDVVILNSTGATGDLDITCGLVLRGNVASETYGIEYRGYPIYDTDGHYSNQQIQSPAKAFPLWNQEMNYWFVANGRRWMVGVEVSTTWQSGYCGLILPFGTPEEYPYPFFIAGMNDAGALTRFSDFDETNRFMASPGRNTASVFVAGASWKTPANHGSSETSYQPQTSTAGYIGPTRSYYANDGTHNQFESWSDQELTNQRQLIDGSYFMRQLIVYADNPQSSEQLGILDGAFWVSGRGQAPGNTIVDPNGDTHIVLQNGNKNTFRDFMTLRLS